MDTFRKYLLKLIGKEVYIKCDFNYLIWNSEKPTLFTNDDYKNIIDLYNSYAHSITIIEPTSKNDIPIISIWRY